MTDTSRGESWINNKHLNSLEEAEEYLKGHGENPNSTFWSQVLPKVFPVSDEEREEEANNILAREEIDREQFEERQRIEEEESDITHRVARIVREIFRGFLST